MHIQKQTTSVTSQQDRLSYLWLALAILFFAFATVRWTIPLTAWLFPVFLLRLPTVTTPDRRLATAICYDADFPSTIRQAGQANADLLLLPGGDWRAIDPFHTQMETFRAIENGFSLVRPTNQGRSMAVDYEGQVLSASDYFTTDRQVMVACVPMQGVHTIYATIGDLFAWLSIAGLVVLIGRAFARRRKASEAGATEPGGEPLPVC